ncbi:MAG TPA: hypothetical protein VLT16_18630 [Candidatus Limnocylindrales bacterium]|nr:hypothetical protein [Candidatus Limnocylindrales bacterium]
MVRFLLLIIILFSMAAFLSGQGPRHERPRARAGPDAARESPPVHFDLWEKQQDLRRRAGRPRQYFVPPIQKLIKPAELRYYSDTYKKVDDVFYRRTDAGEVRVMVAYAADGSESHLNPQIRVEKVHFFFDKDVNLRTALAAIDELRALCSGGCILNGFSSSVVVQPAAPSDAQMLLAKKMRPHWRGQDMSDATPGAEVFYQDSPYPVDFEHSPVDRIDLTLVSNAGKERYTLEIINKQPTVLDVWNPHRHERSRAGIKRERGDGQ